LYNEKDERQKQERKASHEISAALQKLDLEEEERLHKLALEEANELVRRHQNPAAPYQLQPGPWRGVKTMPGAVPVRQGREQPVTPVFNGDVAAQPTKSSMRPTEMAQPNKTEEKPIARMPSVNTGSITMGKQRSPTKFDPFSVANLANRRRSSGSKRLASGGSPKSLFVNPEDKIYEDPNDRENLEDDDKETVPVHVRRNPFARMRSKREVLPSQPAVPLPIPSRISRSERQNSLPSQARGAGYTSNNSFSAQPEAGGDTLETDVAHRNGVEVRSDELRAATSMRMKDRSAKLPRPTGVSDNYSRPIVSFKPDWSPPQPEATGTSSLTFLSLPFRIRTGRLIDEPMKRSALDLPPVTRDSPPPSPQRQEGFNFDIPSTNGSSDEGPHKKQRLYHSPTTLNNLLHDIPSISVTENIPSISVSPVDETQPPMPTISISNDDEPSPVESNISMSQSPPPPTISVDPISSKISMVETYTAPRPAPLPPVPVRPAATRYQSVRQTTASCTNCSLPISGRVVTAASSLFHPACFHCHHCSTALEHVSFYPEPSSHRQARLDRINARRNGTYVPESSADEEQLAYDDGWDETTRFYCHLDYHEHFSPRCKNCKTPIEGEVVVALGASWHPDHFFCAECGDPFKAETPFVEKEGYAWCVACHTQRTSARCRGCKRPVVDVVVSALGAEWHEECFRCVDCKGGFEQGRFWIRSVMEKGEWGRLDREVDMPVCGGCEERRLKM